MFLVSRPTESQIRTLLSCQRPLDFSYPHVGATRREMPAGYAVLQGRINLGQGSATFDRAVEALQQWKMFEVPGMRLYSPDAPIESGEAVAVATKHFGF
jgi:uncharacterized protein (UPF0548 family)